MITFEIKLSKDFIFEEELMKVIDTSNEEYNVFRISVPEENKEKVEDLISHYLQKGLK